MVGDRLNNLQGATIKAGSGGDGTGGVSSSGGAIAGQSDTTTHGNAHAGYAQGGDAVGGDGGNIYLTIGEINNAGRVQAGNGGDGYGGSAHVGGAHGYSGSASTGNATAGDRWSGHGGAIGIKSTKLTNAYNGFIVAGDGGIVRIDTNASATAGSAIAYYNKAVGGDTYVGSAYGGQGGALNLIVAGTLDNSGYIASGKGGWVNGGGHFTAGGADAHVFSGIKAYAGDIYGGSSYGGNGGALNLSATELINQYNTTIFANDGGGARGNDVRGGYNYTQASNVGNNELDTGGNASGGTASAGNGGSLAITVVTAKNEGLIRAGRGGEATGGSAQGGNAQANSSNGTGIGGNAYSGKASGGNGAGVIFSGASLINGFLSRLEGGSGGGAKVEAAVGGNIGYGGGGLLSATRGNAVGGEATGGRGGDALTVVSANTRIDNNETIYGSAKITAGSGGLAIGGEASATYDGNATGGHATGGRGGDALSLLFANALINNNGEITAGSGGKATGGKTNTTYNGSATGGHATGGRGGDALILLSTNALINNENQIAAGSGGSATGGNATRSYKLDDGTGGDPIGGNATGGNGGTALVIMADSNTLINTGKLIGGNGGLATVGTEMVWWPGTNISTTSGTATHGLGGVGLNIQSNYNTISHSGSIIGGLGGDGVTRANAITLSGQHNQLNFSGGNTTGSVIVSGNSNAIGGNGTITGHLSLGDNNALNIQAGKTLNVTGDLTIGSNVVANITEMNQQSQINSVFLHSDGTISGDFSQLFVGGTAVNSADYLKASVSQSGQDYTLSYGLNWFDVSPVNGHGNFTLNNPNGLFVVNADLSDQSGVSTSPSWDGNSLTKKGAGTLILNGVNSYTGTTDIQSGKLVVGGAATNNNAQIAGDVNVQSGAVLGGHGQILGNVVLANGATLAPGNSIGTITVNSITFNPSSIYEFEANPDGTSDKVNVNVVTTATLNGGTVKVLAGAGIWNPSTTYTILTAGTAVNGTFADTSSNLAFLTPSLSYDPNNVFLTLVRNATTLESVADTHNQKQTASGVESLGVTNPIVNAIVGSMDAPTARRAYDNLSGEIYASTSSALLDNSRYVRDALNNHLLSNNSDNASPDSSAWVSVWGHKAETKSDGNAAKTKNESEGFIIGIDKAINDSSSIGVAAGYEHSKIKANDRDSESKADAFHFALYGGTQAGAIDLRAGIGYSSIDIDTDRKIWINTLEGNNKASYKADLWQSFIEGSHTFQINPQTSIMPYLNLAYTYLDTEGTQENNSDTALKIDGRKDKVTYTTVGVKGQYTVADRVSLYGDLGWQHAFGDTDSQSTNRFRAGGDGFNIKGTPIDEDSAVIGLGVNIHLSKATSLSVGYQGSFGSDTTDNSVKARLDYRF